MEDTLVFRYEPLKTLESSKNSWVCATFGLKLRNSGQEWGSASTSIQALLGSVCGSVGVMDGHVKHEWEDKKT